MICMLAFINIKDSIIENKMFMIYGSCLIKEHLIYFEPGAKLVLNKSGLM